MVTVTLTRVNVVAAVVMNAFSGLDHSHSLQFLEHQVEQTRFFLLGLLRVAAGVVIVAWAVIVPVQIMAASRGNVGFVR